VSEIGKELIASMEEALAHAEGKAGNVRIHAPALSPLDVKKARKALNMTQQKFAPLLGTSVSGLQKWEQGTRAPSGAARTLIKLIERAPDAVRQALEDEQTEEDAARA
jgi:putative transcriptional regulator